MPVMYNYSLNTDEDQVLLEMFEFFDDLGIPDHIDQKAYETFQNKFQNYVNTTPRRYAFTNL